MKKIFISYRREDDSDFARRLAEALREEFGKDSVYFDTISNGPGTPWREKLWQQVQAADTFLLVIGKNWLFSQDPSSGRRRLDIETDWVRQEVVTFLSRDPASEGLTFVPVIVGQAEIPRKEYLDGLMQSIPDYQVVRVSNTGNKTDFIPIRQYLIQSQFRPIVPPPVATPIMGLVPRQLTDLHEKEFIDKYKNWKVTERDKPGEPGAVIREIYTVYEFESHNEAWAFMLQVEENCIKYLNHHPRWQNTYNRVEVWLSTFNIGYKPSKRDIRLAECIEKQRGETKKPT